MILASMARQTSGGQNKKGALSFAVPPALFGLNFSVITGKLVSIGHNSTELLPNLTFKASMVVLVVISTHSYSISLAYVATRIFLLCFFFFSLFCWKVRRCVGATDVFNAWRRGRRFFLYAPLVATRNLVVFFHALSLRDWNYLNNKYTLCSSMQSSKRQRTHV